MPKEKLRLSTAIREGIKKFPIQARESYFVFGETTDLDESCAWGAAIFAIYGRASGALIDKLTEDYSEMWHKGVYPDLKCNHIEHQKDLCLRDVVVILNDDKGWTREQIANWLESEGL